ncbi:hypothetical protein BN946_scf184908.g85 [Trametes cinnabarina]|uniref:Uncharacterized protein n=1 Tax=Pycnoporus cinnabarinus TaxID=5643 RepID=A0A060SA32_PYCCI|nr:hypothetical protein BN946_scf184908.g85 [Trametes cinnabarina]
MADSDTATLSDNLSATGSGMPRSEQPYQLRAREFVELHDQVQRIEKPLSNLLVDLCIPPALAALILDTRVDEQWIPAITEFERKLDTLKVRVRVKAARDLSEVAEGLRIVAATKLRTFFLSLLEPMKSSMTTNLQVIQSSVWMKYRPLYVFLQRHAPNVAHEIQRTYAATARTVEKSETIVSGAGESPDPEVDYKRLAYARVEGPSVVMAYMADDKNHKEPLEALIRSALLVLMDNATAEYSFITTFFANEPRPALHSKDSSNSIMSPTLLSPTRGEFDETLSNPGSDYGGESVASRRRLTSITSVISGGTPEQPNAKEELAALNALWKQVMDPVLDYCQTFIQNAIEPPPPVIPLLTIIRLTEDVVAEVQRRGCGPLETYVFAIRLKMWPVFQKLMSEHVDSLKKFAEGATSGYFRRGTTTDAAVSSICRRYVAVFNSFVALTDQAEETMIFSNLLRLRQELSKLIVTHTDKQTDPVAKARALSKFYEQLLQGLSNGPHPTSHPKAQSELAYWRERDEEARRRVASTHGPTNVTQAVRNSPNASSPKSQPKQ